ncbi:MAG: hypothetical protein PUJ09_00540 [Eubacteriales bacterium]|nr:hypothetical protein [Eubacteriales bacterium]
MILALEAQLKEVQSSIDNIMKAIEKGVVTRTTKTRLEELEAEEEKIKWNIKAEEDKKPKITKDFILFTLHKFRNLDLRFEKNKERLIDGLVQAIFVYDNYIKLILTFDDRPISHPKITENHIRCMFDKYRDMDMSIPANRERLIDRLVGSILLYDDGKIVITFYYKDEPFVGMLEEIASASDKVGSDTNALGASK